MSMTVVNEIKYVRELLEKDMLYLKDKMCSIEKKMDDRLKNVEEQTEENTDFRKRFKWTGMMIGSIATVVSFCLMLISYKLKWFGR